MSWNFTASHRGFACKGGPALSQILQRPKYTISGCRRFYNARNTQRRAVADLQQPVAVFDAPPAQDNAQLATGSP